MKIIGRTNSVTLLIEIGQHELNTLTGRTAGAYSSREEYLVGSVYDLQKNWSFLTKILEKKNQINDQARNLRSMADMLESINIISAEILEKEGTNIERLEDA